jgi:hypothetical protein
VGLHWRDFQFIGETPSWDIWYGMLVKGSNDTDSRDVAQTQHLFLRVRLVYTAERKRPSGSQGPTLPLEVNVVSWASF